MKRIFQKLFGREFLIAGVLFSNTVAILAGTKPNIIFILADDLGYGDVGCFYQDSRTNAEEPRMFTPQLDRMAAEGMMFRQHYSACPVCAPARASLLLGQDQGNCAIRDNQFDKALSDNHTLATVLKQAGYYCGAIGKWGLAGQSYLPATYYTNVTATVPGYPLQHGFDEFFGFVAHNSGHVYYHDAAHPLFYDYTNVTSLYTNIYSTDLFFARAKMFVTNRLAAAPNQPFFLYLAPTAVHAALQVPGGPFPAGDGTNGGLQWPLSPVASPNTWIDPLYTNATTSAYFNNVITSTNWNDTMKRYATMDRRLDQGVGDLLQLLRDLNIASNTIVIFSSDNGPANESDGGSYVSDPRYFGSWGNMDGIKRDLWEAGVREPTIAWWPGHVPADTSNDTVSAFWDWLPTFAAVSGDAPPAESDGVSLLPTLTGTGTQNGRGFWYFEYNYGGTFPVDGGANGMFARKDITARGQMQSIRTNNFVAVRYDIQSATDPFRLYNVVADPHEDNDLSGYATNADLLATMSNLCAEVRMVNSSAPRPYDSELMPSVIGVAVTNGVLDYAVYNGAWPWVPDFDALTPVSTGQVAGLNLSVATQTNHFGISFKGYLMIPTDGQYTFYVTDDGGAEMWIHEAHVLDDDFNHTGAEVSGSILLKAGLHPLRLFYRHGTNGTPTLSLQYSGPGIPKQSVPLAMFYSFSTNGQTKATDDSVSTPENTPVAVNVLANDLASDGTGPLSIVNVGTPRAGTAVTNTDGQIVYTPNAGFLGDDSFVYTMTDGSNAASATVHVSVAFEDGMLWFPFDQLSGLTTSDAGGGFTATLQGFANDPAEWVSGKWNKAIQFNGVNNYLSINNYTGVLGASNRTCAAWIKTTGTGQMPVIAWGKYANSNKWTFLIQNGHARIEINAGYLEGATVVNDGQWHHVAVVFANDGTPDIINAKLYVDGTTETSFAASSSLTVDTVANGDVKIGSDVQNRYFLGQIDEPRIYNWALSPDEIAALVTATNQSAAAWYYRYYGTNTIDWNGDSDGDGFSQLAEYAFGGNPRVPDAPPDITAQIVAGQLLIGYLRKQSGTTELDYVVEASDDLKTWSPLAGTDMGAVAAPAHPGYEWATFAKNGSIFGTTNQFIRVQSYLP